MVIALTLVCRGRCRLLGTPSLKLGFLEVFVRNIDLLRRLKASFALRIFSAIKVGHRIRLSRWFSSLIVQFDQTMWAL